MANKLQIISDMQNGELHIQPYGDLDGSAACELVNCLMDHDDDRCRMFIETRGLNHLHPFGCSMFRYRLLLSSIDAKRLCFKGEKGFEIAPNGSMVVAGGESGHSCHCMGKCRVCRCALLENGEPRHGAMEEEIGRPE